MADLSQFGLSPVGSVSPTSGTFTPDTVAPTPQPRANPFRDRGPWGSLAIGQVDVPGVIQAIDGCTKPDEWAVQKGTSSNNATTVWRGRKLAESIKITTALLTAAHVDAYYALRDAMDPKPGTKPPSLPVSNAIFNFSGITSVARKSFDPPKWQAAGGYWIGAFELTETAQSKNATTGAAQPAKAWKDTAPSANDRAAQDIQNTIDQIKRAG